MSFEAYVQELADPGRKLVVSKLISLSDLRPAEAALFGNAWLEMDLRKRQRLIEELIELAEDNVDVNFDAVFFIALADSDAGVRQNAVKGLWEYEGRDLIDALLGLLESDPAAAVRAEAALALGRFVLRVEFESLRASDAERVEQGLRRTIDDEAEVAEVRGRALESIGARTEPWLSELIEGAFGTPDRRLRLSAVHAMGRSCDAAWLPTLFAELGSDDPEMRFEAAGACGSISDEAATPYLQRLLDDDDEEVQEAAIGALGQIGGPLAKKALQDLLSRGDERMREAAFSALAEVDFAAGPLSFRRRG